MKLHSDSTPGAHRVSAYGPGYFIIDDVRHAGSVIITPGADIIESRARALSDIDEETLRRVHSLEPEIVLLGTGSEHRFAEPALLSRLAARQIGVEVMSTDAACRTYNILIAEGRRVVALLLVIDTD